jgi:hypothetical protein
MKLKKLTLDDKEIVQAVQMFLATQGITCPIHCVSKPYSWSEMEVTFQFEIPEEKPPITTPEELGAAIEKGVV